MCVRCVCTCGYVYTTIHVCSFGHNFPEAVLSSTMGSEIKLRLPVFSGKSLVPTEPSLLLCILFFCQCLTHIAQATCHLHVTHTHSPGYPSLNMCMSLHTWTPGLILNFSPFILSWKLLLLISSECWWREQEFLV